MQGGDYASADRWSPLHGNESAFASVDEIQCPLTNQGDTNLQNKGGEQTFIQQHVVPPHNYHYQAATTPTPLQGTIPANTPLHRNRYYVQQPIAPQPVFAGYPSIVHHHPYVPSQPAHPIQQQVSVSASAGPSHNRVQYVPKPTQQPPGQPRDLNQIIKELFARKGISLDHSVKLGSGRYSKVITAETFAGAKIAIKMINKTKVTSDFRNKFLPREISCWKRLEHKHIVPLCGHYEALGHVFLIMEYGAGGDMLSHVQQTGPVPELQAQRWMNEICSAIAYMHGKDMAHRDLKLENVVIFGRHVKIADFGFARKVQNEMSHTFCGSKSYSAPEILLGEAYNPFKADIWSLGVIAFVITTDTMPYRENCSNHKIVEAQRNRAYKFPRTVELTNAGRNAINTFMTFLPHERPSIRDVLDLPWIAAGTDPLSQADAIKSVYCHEQPCKTATPHSEPLTEKNYNVQRMYVSNANNFEDRDHGGPRQLGHKYNTRYAATVQNKRAQDARDKEAFQNLNLGLAFDVGGTAPQVLPVTHPYTHQTYYGGIEPDMNNNVLLEAERASQYFR